MNIRELNKIIKFDFYSMFLQIDIISTMIDFKFIFVIDATTFFYQFRVQSKDRHKLIVVSHREQKYFSVVFMSFKNSLTYAQRQIDRIFRDLKYCKIFIDNITVFFVTLKEHINHLFAIFQRLLDHNIRLNSDKNFLNFSSVVLLDQHVNNLELHAAKDKICKNATLCE
jgi:hypothetical protein